mmetsp:Transcript_59207/g.105207  ORF Transcript_59207/g.105207 Transcript_59207/m.105207 type:complete len:187 (+) Transcript_59207:68-628(+)
MALQKGGQDIVFKPPSTALSLAYFAPHDGGRTTTYEREISTCEAVGDNGKSRQYLTCDRLPKDFLSKEAIEVGNAKARAAMPNAPIRLDPKVRRLMNEIAVAEGTRQQTKMDPEFVDDMKRKAKIDHVTTIFTDPRMPVDDCGTTHLRHHEMGHLADKVDKKHFLQKNFYSEYNEAKAKQKGLGGK